MKPPPLEYFAPRTVTEALDLLAGHGEDAKVLAGGQSLVPLLNFRLARPANLIDINGLTELAEIRAENGGLWIGSLVRHSAVLRSPLVSRFAPLLADAVRFIGHSQIRNRGTVGGSVAHADPAAELPAAFAALDARFHARSATDARTLTSSEFFRTYFTTALRADELLVGIEVPTSAPGCGFAFAEFARRAGDFALGGAAVLVVVAEDGTCRRAAIALLACASTPVRSTEVEAWLVGQVVDARTATQAAEMAAGGIRPTGDVHASSAYRRRLTKMLVRRALLAAVERAEVSR